MKLIKYLNENLISLHRHGDVFTTVGTEISSLGNLAYAFVTKEAFNRIKNKPITNEVLTKEKYIVYGLGYVGYPPEIQIPDCKIDSYGCNSEYISNPMYFTNYILNNFSNKEIVDILLSEDKVFKCEIN